MDINEYEEVQRNFHFGSLNPKIILGKGQLNRLIQNKQMYDMTQTGKI